MTALPPGFVIRGAGPQAAPPGAAPPRATAPAAPRGIPGTGPRPAPAPTVIQQNADARAAAAADRAAAKAAREEAEWNATHNPDGTPKTAAGAVPPKGSMEEARRNAELLLQAAGVDIERGIDPIKGLIEGSTSGGLEEAGANAYGWLTGDATDGMENIAKLQTLVSDMTLQLTGGSLGNQISNADREFIMQRVGNLGDPSVPASARLAAWEQVKSRMANLTGATVPVAGDARERGEDRDAPPIPNATQSGSSGGGGSPPMPGIREPSQQEIYSGGVKWGDQWGGMESSIAEYLAQNYGVDPGEEAAINAFWNTNRGNSGLTVEGVQQWYRERGIGVPKAEDIATAIDQAMKPGVEFTGSGAEAAAAQYESQLDQVLEQRGVDPETTVNAFGANTANGILPLLDEIGGVGGGVKAFLTGQSPSAGYRVERDIVRREQERGAEAHPTAAFLGEMSGAAVTGGAGFTKPARIAQAASRASKLGNAARAANLQRAAVKSTVAPGAATGAFYGFGNGEGASDSAVGAVLGAGGGAVLAPAAQAASPYVSKGFGRIATALKKPEATAAQREVIDAGAATGVPIRRADLDPEGMARSRSVAKTSEGGNAIIREAEDADVQAAEQAVTTRVGGGGNVESRETFGERARAALFRHGDRTRERARALYDQADSQVKGQRFAAPSGSAQIDTEIAALREAGENVNSPMIRYLEGLKADLAGPKAQGMTIRGLRDQRTAVRSNLRNAGLDADAGEAQILRVLDAVGQDIDSALAGKPAQSLYREADAVWRERAAFRKEIAERLLGPRTRPKSGEQISDAFRSMIRDDFARTRRMWEVLDPDEQADMAASLAASLGRDKQGNFSFQRLLSQTVGDGVAQKPTLPASAVQLIFGKEGAQALRDLQTVARAKVAASSETNHSRTGNVVQSAKGGLRTLLLTGLGLSQGGFAGGILAPMAGQMLSRLGEKRAARLVINTDFSRWLSTMPPTATTQDIGRQFAKLEALAAKSPSILFQQDVRALQQTLADAFSQSPGRLAAADQEDN